MVTAQFVGGPLNGEFRALPRPADRFLVPKPLNITYTAEPLDPLAPIDFAYGVYQATGRHISDPNLWRFDWCGWEGEAPPSSSDHGWAVPTAQLIDEPWPDAMRWTPDIGDDEIAAWNEILHPTP